MRLEIRIQNNYIQIILLLRVWGLLILRVLLSPSPCLSPSPSPSPYPRWYYSTGFSLQTVVAVSVTVHIIRNPCITGVIRDVMFTLIAYAACIYTASITTIVSNLDIVKSVTTIVVAAIAHMDGTAAVGTRSCSDDGIFHS